MINLKHLDFILLAVIIINCWSSCIAIGKTCDPSTLVVQHCSQNETCNEKLKLCECKIGFARVGENECRKNETKTIVTTTTTIPPKEESHDGSHLGKLLLIPIPIVFLLLVYFSYKYRVVNWVRAKIHQRQTNYDEVMIGQDDDDDPPLGSERA